MLLRRTQALSKIPRSNDKWPQRRREGDKEGGQETDLLVCVFGNRKSKVNNSQIKDDIAMGFKIF